MKRSELERLDALLGRAIDDGTFESANDQHHARLTREAVQQLLDREVVDTMARK